MEAPRRQESSEIRKTEALERIVDLYEAWQRPEEAATWHAQRAEENEK